MSLPPQSMSRWTVSLMICVTSVAISRRCSCLSGCHLRRSAFSFLLRWLSGNIGYQHIHHLSPRVPNYRLVRCHSAAGIFDSVKPLTLWRSVKTLRMHLWDEGQRRLVSFRQVHRARRRLLR